MRYINPHLFWFDLISTCCNRHFYLCGSLQLHCSLCLLGSFASVCPLSHLHRAFLYFYPSEPLPTVGGFGVVCAGFGQKKPCAATPSGPRHTDTIIAGHYVGTWCYCELFSVVRIQCSLSRAWQAMIMNRTAKVAFSQTMLVANCFSSQSSHATDQPNRCDRQRCRVIEIRGIEMRN